MYISFSLLFTARASQLKQTKIKNGTAHFRELGYLEEVVVPEHCSQKKKKGGGLTGRRHLGSPGMEMKALVLHSHLNHTFSVSKPFKDFHWSC